MFKRQINYNWAMFQFAMLNYQRVTIKNGEEIGIEPWQTGEHISAVGIHPAPKSERFPCGAQLWWFMTSKLWKSTIHAADSQVIWQCVKTLYPCSSHQNSWDLWMFIPTKNGINRYWSIAISSSNCFIPGSASNHPPLKLAGCSPCNQCQRCSIPGCKWHNDPQPGTVESVEAETGGKYGNPGEFGAV